MLGDLKNSRESVDHLSLSVGSQEVDLSWVVDERADQGRASSQPEDMVLGLRLSTER